MTAQLAGKRIIPYGRASQLAGRDADEALRHYRLACERWADTHDVLLLPFRGDVDASGGRLYGRPALEDVMDLIAAGEADGVVTPYVSRFSRAGLGDAVDRIREIRMMGGVFIPLDVSDALNGSDLALNIALSIAEEELRKHRGNWWRGKRDAAEAGCHLGPPPSGYRHKRGPRPSRGGDGGRLEPDPERGPVIRRAFELHASEGAAAAVAHLRQHDDPQHGYWAPNRWRRTTKARAYLGETAYQVRERQRTPLRDDEGQIVREDSGRIKFEETNPVVETISRYGVHEALVDEATWLRCQSGHEVPGRASRGAHYPLSGICYCARCGTDLIGSHSKSKTMKRPTYSYRCGSASGRKHVTKCGPFATMRAEELEGFIRAALVEHALQQEEQLEKLLSNQRGPAGLDALDEDDATRGAEPERLALEQARRDLEATQAAELPAPVKAAALGAAEQAIAAAQERYTSALVEAGPEDEPPEATQIAHAPASKLPSFLEHFGLRVTVAPERAVTKKRVSVANIR